MRAGCHIRITHSYGSRGQIGYSGNDSPQDNSFNEILSVDADDQSMYLKGMMTNRSGREQKLHTKEPPNSFGSFS